ncbi:hypothetical protein [Pseudonocardia oroxyli]|uniref:Uncharacterized protein n=1 Tax=Pseudonocardia oroxyli TaxID=366584 RepID=A0A1G7YKE3_PSEOR|nr:hypothetical protein [Pseudonocardia oroxyli]SDG96837.1 hypothetical protein SAMN05216377_11780 [Pseudonocardia oroxyli]
MAQDKIISETEREAAPGGWCYVHALPGGRWRLVATTGAGTSLNREDATPEQVLATLRLLDAIPADTAAGVDQHALQAALVEATDGEVDLDVQLLADAIGKASQ